jgi:hypothetical protein
MRVLMTGDYPAGMLMLSSANVAIHMIPSPILDDPITELERYIKLCSTGCLEEGIVRVFNTSPWSEILFIDDTDRLKGLKEWIFNKSGWKPDIIINVYNSQNSSELKQQESTTRLAIDGHLTIFSVDLASHNPLANLLAVIREANP